MARLPRYLVAGQPQHVIQRGHNRQAIFVEPRDYRAYLGILKAVSADHGLAVHAYVLMTNHVHLLATPASEQSLSKAMQSLGGRYVRYFNANYGRTGTLWEGRYRATPIDSEHYLLACLRYIEMNPVRAGMVPSPYAYRWSSCAHHVSARSDPLITDHQLYLNLGTTPSARRAAYRELLEEGLSATQLNEIRAAIHKGWALGNDRFKDEVEALSGRRARPAARGRPRKLQQEIGSDTI